MLIKVNEKQYQQIYKEMIDKNYKEDKYYMVVEEPICIHESNAKNYDEEYCKANNIMILHNERPGGTIVTWKGDVGVIYMQDTNKVPIEIERLLHYLIAEKKLNASLAGTHENFGRDVMIDNKYKVAAYVNTIYKDRVFTAMHFSVSVDVELIKRICTKPMVKIPKGLSEYGVTTEDILNLIHK
jgi:hypothetical protein